MPNFILRRLQYAAVAFGGLWLTAFILVQAVAASAQPLAVPTSGITVAPALLTAQIGSAQPETSVTIGVRNNFQVPVTVSAALNGFDVRNNALIPTTTAEKTLAGVVSLSPAEIVIPPSTSKNITVAIHDTVGLSPGGHYLSILLSQTAVKDASRLSQLSFRPAVSATLYIVKEDGAVRSISARSLRLKHSLFSLPKAVDDSFFNDGNVVITPRGVVQLSQKPGDSPFAQAVINQQSAPLYPQSSITLRSSLEKLSSVRLPIHYQVALQYRYDGEETSRSITQTYWYVPKMFVIFVLLLVTVLILGLWPENQRRMRRWWRRDRLPKSPAYVAPKPAKIATIERPLRAPLLLKKRPTPRRRKNHYIQ